MPGTVVIADDEPHILALLRVALRDFRTVEASDGNATLAAIREHEPAVAIVDAHMPGLDGYEVTRAVRADAGGPQPHILMLTAAGREADRERATEAGVDEFLTKPFSPSALRARIAELVGE
ncbi:MAG TPA: response regulator [Gaiellaceae bacterium]|nr:response regulator [Gaiellaceae bacterium]